MCDSGYCYLDATRIAAGPDTRHTGCRPFSNPVLLSAELLLTRESGCLRPYRLNIVSWGMFEPIALNIVNRALRGAPFQPAPKRPVGIAALDRTRIAIRAYPSAFAEMVQLWFST